MTPDRYQHVKQIFYRWCDAAPEERNGVLDELCAGDDALRADALRADVEAMIALEDSAAGGTESFLSSPVFSVDLIGAVLGEAGTGAAVPVQVERYRILRRLGIGGMGVVYEAEQDNPRRTVALKLIKPGVASARTLRRFEFEAQILGRLHHPGIAQIYEAGTFDDGHGLQPFFAMELVRGRRVVDHAREHGLTPRERLALVSRICSAVQHAHQHGIMHRDLKPENILVQEEESTATGARSGRGGVGQPKILDFGVARVTDADLQATTLGTDVGQLIGTLPYMSPEQVRGRRDEVDHRSDVYALGVIAYELLAGRRPHDLADCSLAEAVRVIEEDEATLLGSINRSLGGDAETIVAKAMERDPSRRYQSAADMAADIERSLADQPIVARPASAVYQMQKFAKRNKALVTGASIGFAALLVGFFIAVVALIGALDSAENARREQRAASQVSAFLRDTLSAVDPMTGARSDIRNLRDLLDAAARRAIDELESPDVAAPIHLTIGRAYLALAAFEDAERHLFLARDLTDSFFGRRSVESADVLQALGELRLATSAYPEAERLLRDSLEIRLENGGTDNATVAEGLNRLAATQRALGDYTGAEESLREALRTRERALGPTHPGVARDLDALAVILIDTRALQEAERHVTRALEIRRAAFGDRHPYVAQSLMTLGWLHRRAGRPAEAEKPYRTALEIQLAALDPDHPDVGLSLERLASALEDLEQYDEAESLYRQGLEIQRSVLGPHHRDVGTTLNNIGGLCRNTGQYEEAAKLYTEALEIYREQIGPDHVWTAIVLENIARTHELAGNLAAGEPYAIDCLRIRRKYFAERDEGQAATAVAASLVALCAAERGDFENTEPMLLEAIETIRAERGDTDPRTRVASERAARFYEMWGRTDDAERWAAFAAQDG